MGATAIFEPARASNSCSIENRFAVASRKSAVGDRFTSPFIFQNPVIFHRPQIPLHLNARMRWGHSER